MNRRGAIGVGAAGFAGCSDGPCTPKRDSRLTTRMTVLHAAYECRLFRQFVHGFRCANHQSRARDRCIMDATVAAWILTPRPEKSTVQVALHIDCGTSAESP
jgi:hypothetical protein